ncbi:hypothetical protein EP331_02150 [bacterium]|nr:MAG: hypothetical protein EP331_02150 [bacterium]
MEHEFKAKLTLLESNIAVFDDKNHIQVPFAQLNVNDSLVVGKTYYVRYKEIKTGTCTPYMGSITRVYDN